MKEPKSFTVRVPGDLLAKFRYISQYNARSTSAQLNQYIRRAVAEFEAEHGEIQVPGDEQNK